MIISRREIPEAPTGGPNYNRTIRMSAFWCASRRSRGHFANGISSMGSMIGLPFLEQEAFEEFVRGRAIEA